MMQCYTKSASGHWRIVLTRRYLPVELKQELLEYMGLDSEIKEENLLHESYLATSVLWLEEFIYRRYSQGLLNPNFFIHHRIGKDRYLILYGAYTIIASRLFSHPTKGIVEEAFILGQAFTIETEDIG